MHNSNVVKILDSRNKLKEHPSCFGFTYSFILDDVVEQLSLLHELHDQEELLGSLYYLVELDYVGVANQFEDVNLAGHSLDICHFSYFVFL